MAVLRSDHNIIFLPGFLCDERLFAPQIFALTKAGYNCQTADLTHGKTYEQISKNILQNAPKKFALAGLSMGGTLALEIMKQASDRVTHLALLNTTSKADRSSRARENHIRRVEAGEFEAIMRTDYLPRYLSPQHTDDNLLSTILQMALEFGPDVFIQQSRAMVTRTSMQPILKTINCPTLILTGFDDIMCPPALHEEMANHIKGSTLTIVPDCGHISTLEQPGTVTEGLLRLLGLD